MLYLYTNGYMRFCRFVYITIEKVSLEERAATFVWFEQITCVCIYNYIHGFDMFWILSLDNLDITFHSSIETGEIT